MYQVALIQIMNSGQAYDTAVIFNGALVATADPGLGDDTEEVEDLAVHLAIAMGTTPKIIGYDRGKLEERWEWEQVRRDLICLGDVVAGLGDEDFVKRFYRCPGCGYHWENIRTTVGDEACPVCHGPGVTPYCTCRPRDSGFDPLPHLAGHERHFPLNTNNFTYEVEVSRTATRTAVISIEDAAGTADAIEKAIEQAGDVEFPLENDANYQFVGVRSAAKE